MASSTPSSSHPIKLKLKLGGSSTTHGTASNGQSSSTIDDWDEDDLLRSIDNDQSNVAGPSSTPSGRGKKTKTASKPAVPMAGGSKLKLKLNLGGKSTPVKDDKDKAKGEDVVHVASTPKIKFHLKKPSTTSGGVPSGDERKDTAEVPLVTPIKPSKRKQAKPKLDNDTATEATSSGSTITPKIKVKLGSASTSLGSTSVPSASVDPEKEQKDEVKEHGDEMIEVLPRTPVGKPKFKLKSKVASVAGSNASPSTDVGPAPASTSTSTLTPTPTSTPIPSGGSPSEAQSDHDENDTPSSPIASPLAGKSKRPRNGATTKTGKKREKSKLRQEVGVDDVVEPGVQEQVQENAASEVHVEVGVQEMDVLDVKQEAVTGVMQDEPTTTTTATTGEAAAGGNPDDMDQDHDDDHDDDGDQDHDQDDENNPDSMDVDGDGNPITKRHPAHPNRIPGGKGGGRNKKPFAFRKKPLGHLLTTIIGNLRRKDAYGLFFDPVSLEEYPNYFEVIGGEDRAMDLGTMEDKVAKGDYKSMAEFEDDVDKMITAAQKFNPDDTLVHREAAKVAQLATRQFNRFRSLVKTPSPSPERETSGMGTPGFADLVGGSVGPTPSNRSVSPTGTVYKEALAAGTLERSAVAQLLPRQLVPEGMLDYPPNSDVARCVGWYLSGGKRHRSKKEQRAKEKWDGTWREWNVDGDRNVREADNILDLLRQGFTFETSGLGVTLPRTVDWQDEAMNASDRWQPTPTLTGIVADEVVPQVPTRPIDHFDVGRFQNLAGSYGFPEFKRYDVRKFVRDLTVDLESVWRDEETDLVEKPSKVVKEMCLGEDITSEAYVRSVEAFLSGPRNDNDRKRKHVEVDASVVKAETKSVDAHDTSGFDLGMSLEDYVNTRWRDGWLHAGMRGTVKRTQEMYREIVATEPGHQAKRPKLEDVLDADELDVGAIGRELFRGVVKDAAKRIPIMLELEEYAARRNGLDLACLLHATTDFAAGGSATGPPPNTGAGRAAWYEKSLKLAGEQLVEATKRRATLTSDELNGEQEIERMKRLRLDLLSLAKNVPVYELRPMTPTEVEKLPMAVRGLIKVVSKP